MFLNTGQPLGDQSISISQSGQHLVTARSTAEGRIDLKQLTGGLYRVDYGTQAALVRLWTASAAPPCAATELMLVKSVNIQRGQCGCDDGACDGGCDVCSDEVVYGDGCEGPNAFGGILGNEPIMIGLLIAAAIAIPIAVHNSAADSDDAS